MSRVYDNWERLVKATLKREDLRRIALCPSFNSSISSDFSSRFSFDSTLQDVSARGITTEDINDSYRDVQPIAFEELKKATKNFHPNLILEQVGGGIVYKGWIHEGGHQSLSWTTRIKVAIGAARGLLFLHDREIQVIHRDLQASNILLDGEFNAKLSGLVLARDGPTGDMTHVSTKIVGTYGYAAPEYLTTGLLTAKCDVFAFGFVLLEILSGRRVLDYNRANGEQNLVDWVKKYMKEDKKKLWRMMDPKFESQYPQDGAHNAVKLACQCVNSNPKLRPDMAEVLVALKRL